MADKTISELPAATEINPADLFVLQQQATNSARSLQGQVLVAWLTNYADGHGGIQGIAKTSTSGLVDTYTISYADGTVGTFTVTNGAKGDTGAQTYVWIKWAAQNPTADNQLSNNPDKWIGIYTGTASTAPTTRTSYKWYEYKGEKGEQGDAVTAVVKTGGTSDPGTTDTYTMYVGEQSIGTFTVYNGLNGTGAVNTVNNILPDVDGNVSLVATDVGAVPAGQGIPAGGTAGQYLRKSSAADYVVGWSDLFKVLYAGEKAGQGVTVTLDDAYNNYDILILTWKTNVDYYTQVIDTAAIQASLNYFTWFANSAVSNGLQSTAYIQFPTSTTINVIQVSYNNSSWTLGIVRVIGIRLH